MDHTIPTHATLATTLQSIDLSDNDATPILHKQAPCLNDTKPINDTFASINFNRTKTMVEIKVIVLNLLNICHLII